MMVKLRRPGNEIRDRVKSSVMTEDPAFCWWKERIFGHGQGIPLKTNASELQASAPLASTHSPEKVKLPENAETNVEGCSSILLDIDDVEDSVEEENMCCTVRIFMDDRRLRYTMKRTDSFAVVFALAAHELNQNKDDLCFFHATDVLCSNTTPELLNLPNYIIVEARAVKSSSTITKKVACIELNNWIKLKFQTDALRLSSVEIDVDPDEAFGSIKEKFLASKPICKDGGQLMFKFDGEVIDCYSTPSQLGMEDDDCVDVFVIS